MLAFGQGWALLEKLSSITPPYRPLLYKLKSLWEEPTGPEHELHINWPMHIVEYAYKIAPDLATHLAPHLFYDVSPNVVTHGDCTLDNMMTRGTCDGVFIDPLPPERHTPAVRALDVGKVLQSLHGWHAIEYDPHHTHLGVQDTVTDFITRGLPPAEVKAAWAFCVYHLIRALPYATHRAQVYQLARTLIKEKLDAGHTTA